MLLRIKNRFKIVIFFYVTNLYQMGRDLIDMLGQKDNKFLGAKSKE